MRLGIIWLEFNRALEHLARLFAFVWRDPLI
jgi:hypothetical protein